MAYATLTDLIERAGDKEIREIADRDRDGLPDPDVIDAALADADNLINGYVSTKYALPLPSVPDVVRTWAVSIARYVLHRNGPPEHVVRDYKEAVAALKDVASGKLSLPFPAGEEQPAVVSGQVMGVHPEKVFTPSKLKGWR